MPLEIPCIDGLLGCAQSDSDSGSQFSVSHWEGYSSSGVSVSSWSPSSQSTAGALGNAVNTSQGTFVAAGQQSSIRGIGSSLGSVAGYAKEYLATYVITAKNKTNALLSNVRLVHGPIPFDALFEPNRSTQGCSLNANQSVECVTDLQPGESKVVTVAYTVKNSLSCMLAKALQKAKSLVGSMTSSSASDPVTTTVSCSVSSAAGGSQASAASSAAGLQSTAQSSSVSSSLSAQNMGSLEYTITATNKTQSVLNSIRISQGPIPSRFTFDAAGSSPQCIPGAGQVLDCAATFQPGETKTFIASYKVPDASSCTQETALTTPKSVTSYVTGAIDDKQMTVSIACAMKQPGGAGQAGVAGQGYGTTLSGGVLSSSGLRPGESLLARYTLRATNTTAMIQSGITIAHAPLPANTVFDASRSSPECKQVGSEVQCVTTFQPGETKEFQVAYTVQDPAVCVSEPLLKAVRSVTNQSGTSAVGQVPVSVQCSIQVIGSTGVSTISDGGAGMTGKKGKGTKPYPRTGVADAYFAAPGKSSWSVLPARQVAGLDHLTGVSIGLVSGVFVCVLLTAIYLILKRKTGFVEQ